MAVRVVNACCLRPTPSLAAGLSLRHSSSSGNSEITGASRVWPSYQHTRAAPDHPVPSFGDTKEAYRSKTFSELLRHYAVFKTFTFKYLVDNNKSVSGCVGTSYWVSKSMFWMSLK